MTTDVNNCLNSGNITTELQLFVYGFFSDLDDALYLSQACRSLRSVHQMQKRVIERQIIVRRSAALA